MGYRRPPDPGDSSQFADKYSSAVQRLFPSFPAGRAGLGLLLLRVAVGVAALVQAAGYVDSSDHSTVAIRVGSLVVGVGAVGLVIGLLTPVPAIVLACLVPVLWAVHGTDGGTAAVLTTLLVAANAVAVALLGPGTFSMDGRLFGRREIIIPPQATTHDSSGADRE